jgi:excisionase family DNA binding protein
MSNGSELPESVSRNAFHREQLLAGVTNGRWLVSIPDAMQALKLGRTKIYDLIEAGDLERVKVGAASRITVSSIETFVERLREQARERAA